MYRTKYKCEVITPMFLRGEDKETPELRASSIKGSLRFWWRSLHGYLKEDVLKQKEKELFGGIGDNSRKSAFFIKTKLIEDVSIKGEYEKFNPLPHKKKFDNKNNKFDKKAFSVGTKFEVEFIVKPFVYNKNHKKDGKEIIEEIENLFELMSILGGLGMRSRRGFGAFKIIKKETDFYDINKIIEKIDIYAKDKYALKDINTIESNNMSKNLVNTSIKQIILTNYCYKNADELTYKIGKVSHNARSTDNYDFDVTKYNIENALGKVFKSNRLASPIYVSAIACKGGLKIIITKLNSRKVSNKENKIQDEFIKELW